MKSKVSTLSPGIYKDDEAGSMWPQLLAAFAATIAMFTAGLNTGWPSPSIPKLLSDEYPFDVTNDEASYITIISQIGNLVGGFCAATIIDVIGRRKTILLISVPQMLLFIMMALSSVAKELLYVARFVGGMGEGATFSIILLYVSEIAEPRVRGKLGMLGTVSCVSGALFINLLGSYVPINVAAGISMVFPILFVLAFWRMPESPYYLLMNGKQAEAEAALQYLRRKRNVKKELDLLTNDVKRQMSESGTYKDIFTIKANRNAFLLMFGARTFQQLTGITAFSMYAQVMLSNATEALPPHIASSVLFLIQIVVVSCAGMLLDKFGRRPLLLVSSFGCCLDLLVLGTYFVLKEQTDIDLSHLDWLPLALMVLFTVLVSMGLLSTINVLISEVFSASIKAKAVCVVNISFAMGMMGTVKFYQFTADTYGLAVPFYSFGVWTFVSVLFFYFCLPETKGKTLEEIQQILRGNGGGSAKT